MKTNLFKTLCLLCMTSFVGCSSSDNDTDINDLIIDNQVYDVWDGNGIPSWLRERYFDFIFHDTDWMTESYYVPMLYEVSKSSYKNHTLVAVSYERIGFNRNYYHQSGTLCYTDEGRRIKFEDIKDHFEKNAVTLWTNRMDGNNIPKVSDFGLESAESLGWLQTHINEICEDIKEPEQFLYEIACGYASGESETYIILDYKYFDKQNLNNGEIKVRNIYTLDGKEVHTTENINIKEEELCSQKIIDLLDYLQVM